MTKVKSSVSVLFVLLLMVITPLTAFAEDSNRGEVRSNLSSGGWDVVYGDLINEADYVLFIAAVAAAVACECPAPIYEYFDQQLQAQVTKIEQSAPEIAQDVLIDLLIQAFDSNGAVLTRGNLEVSAGLATYNRWETVIYHEPRTYDCGQFLGIPCTTMEEVKREIPLPNNFQPYFRFRWKSSTGGGTEGTTGGLHFRNNTGSSIWLVLGYKDSSVNEWVAKGWYEIESGKTRTLVSNDLTKRYYYYYAESGNTTWEGDYGFWIHPSSAFGPTPDSLSAAATQSQGLIWQGFREIDTGDHSSYTINLNP